MTASIFAVSVLGITSCVPQQDESVKPVANVAVSKNAININAATAEELEGLPGIGETLAKRIVEYRDKNGKFRKPEYLILVPGISERRFRQIRSLIRTN